MSNIPKLRFKEFSGEWEEKLLDTIAKFTKGKGVSKADLSENGETECIRYGELYTKYNELIQNIESKTSIDKDELVLSEYGDIIIPASGETQIDIATASCVLKDNVALGGDLNIIKTKEDGVFLSYYLNNAKKFDIARLSQGISVVHLYSSQLKTLKLNLPLKQEQEKIASFLTSVDTKIEQLTKKEELLKQYKKGVMKQIFSQEIRFKADDGGKFPEWEETSLRKIFKERKLLATKAEGYEHISLTTEGVIPKSERYERDFLVSDDNVKKYKVTKLNDICYNPANLKFGVISRNKYADGIFSPIYVTFEVINADIQFVEYFITRWDFINRVRKYEEGTVYERQAVKPEDFLKFSIAIPSIDEQTKIANFLSVIDIKIEQAKKQLDSTKEFKKALLQQMFV